MLSRVITAKVTGGNNSDKTGGTYVYFNDILSDTGPVEGLAIVSATLHLSSFKSYSSNYYLDIIYGNAYGEIVGSTENYEVHESVHSGTVDLSSFSPSMLSSEVSQLTLGVTATSNPTGGKINIRTGCVLTLTINYDVTACTPPTTVEVDRARVSRGAKVTLSWSGAFDGVGNPIIGYNILRATSEEGEYSTIATLSSTVGDGSITVTAPTTDGATYYYKVQTLGTKAGYDSALSVPVASLTCAIAMSSAPTRVEVDTTNVAPGLDVLLAWYDAKDGENNPITGYNVYRAESVAGPYTLLLENVGGSDAAKGSAYVKAPTESGRTYYFKVQACSQEGEEYYSEISAAYAALTCTYSSPSPPTKVTLDGATSVYTLPGEYPDTSLTLSWSGARKGANNEITGYDIYINGEIWAGGYSVDTRSAMVPVAETPGTFNTYAVVAVGEYSDSAPSAVVVAYTYTHPGAPTAVSVSEAETVPGARVKLSWEGATAGGYNDIVGFLVYRADAVNGTGELVARLTSDASSCYVDAPAKAGAVYYYRVATVGSYSTGAQSTEYASVTASGSASVQDSELKVVITPKPPREKRGMLLGDYDTAAHGWTLTGWSFPEPETQTNYISVPGRSAGPLDVSTALTNGDPRYGSRTLAATFECSEGTRLEREALISDMVNRLHGQLKESILPDDKSRYIVGRISVVKGYNDPAHAAVNVTAVCEPWRYSKRETSLELIAFDDERTVALCNAGRKIIIPELTVSGYEASVTLACEGKTWTLTAGTYRLTDLIIPTGSTLLTYSGTGTVTITYREGIL